MKYLFFSTIIAMANLIALAQQNKIDYISILHEDNTFVKEDTTGYIRFTYDQYTTGVGPNTIHNPKNYFGLNDIAQNGDQLDQQLQIMSWWRKNVPYDGSNYPASEMSAIDIYNYSKASGQGVNCLGMAIALNECFLSMGFKSRYIWCMPKDPNDSESHVIVSVYSDEFEKWIWMDPSHNAYVMDTLGIPLSIMEVRQKLIDNEKIVLNDDCDLSAFDNPTIIGYLEEYMAKNLYRFECRQHSSYGIESNYHSDLINVNLVCLVPFGYTFDYEEYSIKTSDPKFFWQKP